MYLCASALCLALTAPAADISSRMLVCIPTINGEVEEPVSVYLEKNLKAEYLVGSGHYVFAEAERVIDFRMELASAEDVSERTTAFNVKFGVIHSRAVAPGHKPTSHDVDATRNGMGGMASASAGFELSRSARHFAFEVTLEGTPEENYAAVALSCSLKPATLPDSAFVNP